MKKILSLVLAIMMVLSLTTVAFAGTFEDVTDASTAKAVDALSSLGIVNGSPDGTYRPQDTVTRGEMAKLLVVALGHGDLASGSKSSFSDSQGKWYDGYAAVAQSLGITNGTGSGKFEGDKQITYSEVITMAMRALGYNDRSVNTNRQEVYNATSYKTAAAKLGLLKNVTVKLDGANRGDVAKIVYNALDCVTVIIDKDGNPVAQTYIVGTATYAKKLIDAVAKAVEHTVSTADLFQKHTADLTEYLGEEVIAYVADTDMANNASQRNILFVNRSLDAYYNRINKTSMTAGDVGITGNEVSIYINSSLTRKIDITTANVIINNVVQPKTVATANAIKNMADANSTNTVKYIAPSTSSDVATVVIENVNNTMLANAEYIAGKTKYLGMNLPKNTDGTVNFKKVIVVGDASSLEDIQVNDVVQACYVSANNVKIYVTRNSITGIITEKAVDNTAYYVDDTKYDANYSSGIQGDATSIGLGYKGTFFLDKDGAIAFADTAVASNAKYGVILKMENGVYSNRFTKTVSIYPQIKMINAEGKAVIYDVQTSLNSSGAWTQPVGFSVTEGASNALTLAITATGLLDVNPTSTSGTEEYLVKYTLNDAGRISKIERVSTSALTTGKKTDAKFLADENTILFGRTDTGSYSLIDLSKLTDASLGYRTVTNANSFGWEFAIITSGLNDATTVKTYAVINSITDVLNSNNITVSKITAYVDGVKVTYVTDAHVGNIGTTYGVTDVYALEFNTNGTIRTAGTNPTTIAGSAQGRLTPAGGVTATAISSNGLRMAVEGSLDTHYTLSQNVVIYRQHAYAAYNYGATVADLNDIRIMNGTAKVSLYDKDGDGVIDVIYLHN